MINIFFNIKNIFSNIFNYFILKNKIKNTNENIYIQIEFFLKEIYENWKNKNINNTDITYDILNLFIKYNKNNFINKIEDKFVHKVDEGPAHLAERSDSSRILDDTDMKYYTLGWYIYQCIENKKL